MITAGFNIIKSMYDARTAYIQSIPKMKPFNLNLCQREVACINITSLCAELQSHTHD